jgi:hypothetical protein
MTGPSRPWFWIASLIKVKASTRPALAYDVHYGVGRPARTIRDGVITDEILLEVLGWLPAEKRIQLYNTKHRGGAIEHDGFLLTLDAKSARELQSKAEW